jgi:hypothetical protein
VSALAALVLLLAPLQGTPSDSLLINGDFEAPVPPEGGVPGWALGIGATDGAEEPRSLATVVPARSERESAHLVLSGDGSTRAWRTITQDLPVRAGATVTVTARLSTEDVRREGAQRDNAYAGIFLLDIQGKRIESSIAPAAGPDAPWHDVSASAVAPPAARTARVVLFLSQSGTLRADDVVVRIDGPAAPAAELVLREGFDAPALPEGWEVLEGARSGPTERASLVELAEEEPHLPGRCLRLAGDADTHRWMLVGRSVPTEPGDAWRLTCRVRALDVRREGRQYENLHTNLLFLDDTGETIGPTAFVQAERGTTPWQPLALEAVAPAGATHVRAGFFLSMSGAADLDDLMLTRVRASEVPYGGWIESAGAHVVVHHPPDHPYALMMDHCIARWDAGLLRVADALGLEPGEPIAIYLYEGDEDGRRLTGRQLDFADPANRTVHVRPSSSLTHEIAHVMAVEIGPAGTTLFGEGLAVWFDGRKPAETHGRAARLAEQGRLPALDELLERFREDEARTYPAAGSLFGYIAIEHGLAAALEMYLSADPLAEAPRVLGDDLELIDRLWRLELDELSR